MDIAVCRRAGGADALGGDGCLCATGIPRSRPRISPEATRILLWVSVSGYPLWEKRLHQGTSVRSGSIVKLPMSENCPSRTWRRGRLCPHPSALADLAIRRQPSNYTTFKTSRRFSGWQPTNRHEPSPCAFYRCEEFDAVTISINPLFANEVVDCVAEGRDPTLHELFSVAQRIWAEGAADRSAFAWGKLPTSSPARVDALRAAQLALCGAPDVAT